jgi:hypothetical protein
LDETLGLAVGTGGEGLGEKVLESMGLAEAEESVGFVAGAIIGEQALNADAEPGVVGNGSLQKSGCGRPFLVRKNRQEGNAGMVIDSDMKILPACSLAMAAAIAMNAVTDTADTGEFLDVQVEQTSRIGILIAQNRKGRFEQTQAMQTETTQDAAYGGRAEAGGSGNTTAGPSLSAEQLHLVHQCLRSQTRQPMGTRRTVAQPG